MSSIYEQWAGSITNPVHISMDIIDRQPHFGVIPLLHGLEAVVGALGIIRTVFHLVVAGEVGDSQGQFGWHWDLPVLYSMGLGTNAAEDLHHD